jgi:ketosteroid isomerase-like protein
VKNPNRSFPGRTFVLSLVLALTTSCGLRSSASEASEGSKSEIQQQIARYTAAFDAANIEVASQVWLTSPDVSFIHPTGHAHGWEEVKEIYRAFGSAFSERKLTTRDVSIHVNGETAWAEFYWHFAAKQRSDGAQMETDGRETQVYQSVGNRWRLVHVHYSGRAMQPPQ